MQIIVINTLYTFLISLLVTKNLEKNLYIFMKEDMPINILNEFKRKKINIKVLDFINQEEKSKIKKGVNYYIQKINYLIWAVKILSTQNIENIFLNDDLDISIPFRFFKYSILEDGTINYDKNLMEAYSERPKNLKEKIKMYIKLAPPNYKAYGFSDKVEKIYLTGLAPILKELEKKVEIINLKELWNKKSEDDKKAILEIFGVDKIITDEMSKKILFLTQPFSEDNFITLEEEMEMYENILKNYDMKNVIIKTHPRETKNYKLYFPKIEIVDFKFPAELFSITGAKFKKIVTVTSTSALNLAEDSELEFLGSKIHPKLFKILGDVSLENFRKNK